MTASWTTDLEFEAPIAGDRGRPFFRPTTALNAAAGAILGAFPFRRLEGRNFAAALDRSADALVSCVGTGARAPLKEVFAKTRWLIDRDTPAPTNVWSGECTFPPAGPLVVLYEQSIWTRLPGARLYEIGTQTTADHMLGHLYSYFAGLPYGEEAACFAQHRLARERGQLALAAVVPLVHHAHKRIPLSEYRRDHFRRGS